MKTAIQILTYLVISHLLLAQKTNTQQTIPFKKYQDYLKASGNMDSLKKVLSTQPPKINTIQYLNLHLSFELGTTHEYDTLNTQKVKQLMQLAVKLKAQPDLGVAYLLLGLSYNVKREDSLNFFYADRAEKIFTKNNDTTGLLASYRLLRDVVISESEEDTDLGKSYFNKLNALSLKSSNPTDRHFYYLHFLAADPGFEKKPTLSQLQEVFRKAIELNDKYPYLNFRRRTLYRNLMWGCKELNEYNEAYKVVKQLFQDPKVKVNIIDYINLGRACFRVKKYDEAIATLEIARKNMSSLIPDSYKYQMNICKVLKDSYYAVGNLKAAIEVDEEYDRLDEIAYENDRNLAMVSLREKYSFEAKMDELKRLSLENQIAQTQKRILILSLLAAVAVIVAIGALFFKLSQKNKELHILQKSREKLYTIIAHDLRSPLSTFQRYSDIITYLIKTKQFTRLETTTHHVDQTSKNLINLLNNLLGWSLNQQGLVKNMPESVKIKDFFDSIFPIYRDMANLNSLQLVTEIEDTSISIDPNKFALIVRNMLDNAIKFSEENNQVQIQARLFDNTFLLTIVNKSKTSTTKQKKAIKELFESEKDYTIGENRNLGIGLIIVKEYAKIMDAKIAFDYDINCLTTFSFELPQTEVISKKNSIPSSRKNINRDIPIHFTLKIAQKAYS
ncbi:hypothetical protein GCM10027035_23210 [Emticicia sediminis]